MFFLAQQLRLQCRNGGFCCNQSVFQFGVVIVKCMAQIFGLRRFEPPANPAGNKNRVVLYQPCGFNSGP
jgi:hypothetical protein